MHNGYPFLLASNRGRLLRNIAARASLGWFLFAWPFVTFFTAAAWFMVDETSGARGAVAERVYLLGALMLFVYPLLVWLKVKLSWLAMAAAAISAHPLPILVAAITCMSIKGLIATGIVGWDGTSGRSDAMLYSALTILAALLFRIRNRASPFDAAPRTCTAFPQPTQENEHGPDLANTSER